MENTPIHPRRILVRGVNWLGDAVMTTPALLRLREKFPDAFISVLTPLKLSELYFKHSAINETLAITPDDNLLGVARKLRPKKFDLALVFPNSPRSAIESWLAGIPRRVGYARPWRKFFLTENVVSRPGAVKMRKRAPSEINALISSPNPTSRIPYPVSAHQIHEYLHLVAALGASPEPLVPQLLVTPEEIASAREKFGIEGVSDPIFGLNPGAEYGPAKRWPVDKFIAAAREIHRQTNCVWLLFGGKGDTTITGQISSAFHESRITHHNLAGKTSLRELMALLKLCRVLLTNDTGPMHVAAAMGTPVVVPFGSTSPELTGPGMPGDARHQLLKSPVPCSPCFLRECPIDFRCMNGIGAERVVEAVVEALKT